jgi:phage-related minor tail protein
MENAFVNGFTNMVTTGKLKFKDLISTMIKELVRLAAQQAFKWLLSWATGGTSDIFGAVAKLFGFADGGYVATNGPILVGERGPEIISGMGGRTVTPNDKLGDALGGGGGGSVNYYITAVDSQSFKQMVARDPEFLYAVTEKGRQRSPMGR